MCAECRWWKGPGPHYGECTHPAMTFDLVPYTQKPERFGVRDPDTGKMRLGTLAEFNDYNRPLPQPVTAHDYGCEHEQPPR